MMHLAGRRDRDVWLSDRHLYGAGEQHGSGARPAVLKPRHGIMRCFKARQEAALFGEAAVNTGRVCSRSRGLTSTLRTTPSKKVLKVRLAHFSTEPSYFLQQLNINSVTKYFKTL